MRRLLLLAVLPVLVLYVGIYAALSAGGEYEVAASGDTRLLTGVRIIPNERRWQPAGIEWQPYRDGDGRGVEANWLGWLFCPLVMIDQAWIHETEKLDI